MSGFERALEANPAPSRLGDVGLRFAPSMLIGETAARPGTWRPAAMVTLGLGLVSLGMVTLALANEWAAFASIVSGGGLVAGSVWLARFERRKRGFVVNFATSTLRLDFVTPFAGRARTLLVPFDRVAAVELLEQGDGLRCLTVEFAEGEVRLQEVLAAFIGSEEDDAARRLTRVLQGAFGLGEIPPDSPFLAAEREPTHEAEATLPTLHDPPAST